MTVHGLPEKVRVAQSSFGMLHFYGPTMPLGRMLVVLSALHNTNA